MSQPVHQIRSGLLMVTVCRDTDSDTGLDRYTVNPSRWSRQGDQSWDNQPWGETPASLGFDDLLPAATELRRRADALAVTADGQRQRADDLRIMAGLLRLAHQSIAERRQADAAQGSDAA